MVSITRANVQKLKSLCRSICQHLVIHSGAYLVLIALVGAAGLYALRTPFFEIASEPWHWRRIQTTWGGTLPQGLSDLGMFPVVLEVDAQPPLYYWLGAVLTRSLPVAQDTAEYRLNPYLSLANLAPVGNKNALLARVPARADGPLAQALWRLRFLSTAWAAASLPFLYSIFLRLTRRNIPLSVGALAAATLLPGYLLMASSINNAAMGFFLLTLSIYLALRLEEASSPLAAMHWGATFAAILAVLTAWWGWLAIVCVAWAQVQALRRGSKERWWSWLVPSLLLMGGAGLTWPLWRLAIYPWGEAHLLWRTVQELPWGQRALLAFKGFLGAFGWLNVPATSAHYTALGIVGLLGLSGLFLNTLRSRWIGQRVSSDKPWQTIGLLYGLGGIAFFTISTLIPHYLYIGHALAPLAPLLVLAVLAGLRFWLRHGYGRALLILPIAVVTITSLGAPRLYIAPTYTAPPPLDMDHLPPSLRDLDVSFGSDLYLLGYQLDDTGLEPGEILRLNLYWLARRPMPTDYIAHVTLLGFNDALIGDFMGYIGGVHPTSAWKPGDVIVHPIAIRIAPEAEAPTAIDVRLSVYKDIQEEAIAAMDPHGNPLGGNFIIAQARLAAPYHVRYIPERPLEVNLDNEVSLVGYGFSPALPIPGENWKIILYWRSEGPLIRDYTVFIHLVDSNGNMVAQVDGPPLDGNYPTSLWGMGEYIRDVHYIPVPSPLPSGEYRLRVGLYRLDTGQRLTVLDSDPPLDYITLGPINIP